MPDAPPRFTIRGLLGLTAAVAAATAALVNASTELAGTLALAAYVALLVATLAALFAGGWARAMGLGFAAFGGGYVLLFRSWNVGDGMESALGTTSVLFAIAPSLRAGIDRNFDTISVGEALWAFVYAVGGAACGWWTWRQRHPSPSPTRVRTWLARVAWLGAWCAAFAGLAYATANATAATAGIVACLLAVALLAAAVIACIGRGRRRAFAAGVAIGGLTYAGLLGFVLDDETMERRLVTTQLLMAVHPHVAEVVASSSKLPPGLWLRSPQWDAFVAVGQGLWTLAFALVGGIAGWWFHVVESRRSAAREAPA